MPFVSIQKIRFDNVILPSIIPCQLKNHSLCKILWKYFINWSYAFFLLGHCSPKRSTSKVSNECSDTKIFMLTNVHSSWANMKISHCLVAATANVRCKHSQWVALIFIAFLLFAFYLNLLIHSLLSLLIIVWKHFHSWDSLKISFTKASILIWAWN